ncbi:MAG: 2-C-methyl-D-erythritol 4-phosphate cytidylyltransferase [Victivallales bacterium]|nr:2-C-methyl-D-erythritol 4-phosphate cytidylyltransferase [Victivallales bacterium]
MSEFGLIVVAGGSSSRFGRNKLFERLDGRPVFVMCLQNLVPVVGVENAVLVVPSALRDEFRSILETFSLGGIRLADGGADRAASVRSGLAALPPNIEYVAVQDAARPFTTSALLRRCYAAAVQYGASVAAHRVTDTIKVSDGDGFAVSTPDRSTLWAAETPQVARRSLLEEAYRHCAENGIAVTDDVQAVQILGHRVKLVENQEINIKITYPQDLSFAESVCASLQNNKEQ